MSCNIENNETYSYEKCLELKSQYEDDIKRIKSELDLSNRNSEFRNTFNRVCNVINETDDVIKKTEKNKDEIVAYLEDAIEAQNILANFSEQLNILECAQQYIKVLQCIETLSNNLEIQLKNCDYEQCSTTFANITEICRHLASTPATYLQGYIQETVYHWYNILKKHFVKDFDDILKTINWPFVNVNFSVEVPSEVNLKKLQILVEYLLQIDLPEELIIPSQTTTLLSSFPQLSLPLQFLIEPLQKRFLYHFYGSRKTNRIDKPEWYFTKILSWIRDHCEFVEKWIQPIVDKMGLYHVEAKVELMRGLVQLAVEKLYTDLPALQYNDFAFSHCIDEALGFDKELRESYDYPPSQPGVLLVLTQAQVFIKWMSMEKKYALEKIDTAFSESFGDYSSFLLGTDDCKITPCAEIFITLLQTITERYEALPQPGHRLQFLDLQLELLDDFRVRLLQLARVEEGEEINSKISVIANTTNYIENVLIDWGSMLHFLTLFYYKSQFEKQEIKLSPSEDISNGISYDIDAATVFTDILSLYKHMKNDLLSSLVDNIVLRAKKYCKPYCHEMWSNMKIAKDKRSLSLTPSACAIFEVLALNLHQLQKYLMSELFNTVWKLVAQNMDTFLFEELVLENRFNEDGARQFKFDIERNLFPLFSQYTDKPEKYCLKINEASNLLNISKGSALLLRETLIALEGATGVEDRRGQALKEIGVESFEPKTALLVLNQRVDIIVNRITFID